MTEQNSANHAALIRRALVRLEELEGQLRDVQEAAHEPIAVVGMACRFPGAPDCDAFQSLLSAGVNAIGEVPPDRWDLDRWYDADASKPGKMAVRHGGFLPDAALFDARFFGISTEEARAMDPQHRILLEVAWHAIEDAGLTRERLRRDRAGVFVGICGNDYGALTLRGPMEQLSAYTGAGNAQSVAAGRLAYFLGSDGPAIALDTACSSSLVAVHLAVRSLRARDCRSALAGGVNLLAAPPYTLSFAKAGMLAQDGRCKVFDDAADGYVRGEGCGVVLLKRLSDALVDRDRIHGILRGTAINADGRTSGITVPSGAAQQEVMRAALDNARLRPEQVAYVEAHGTGTALGDPIELVALDAVYGQTGERAEPLRVGSVKSNIGHLEAAAGVASLIKVLLAMRTGTIPRSLHFNRPNTRVNWERLNVRVMDEPRAWPDGARRAGISSFGFSGTNAHVIVENWTQQTATTDMPNGPLHLLLSARTSDALSDLALAYSRRIDPQNAAAVCAAARQRRERFPHRLSIRGAHAAELRTALEQFAATGRLPAGAHDDDFVHDGVDTEVTGHIDLPLYLFQRERYWLDHGWDAPAGSAEPIPATDVYRMEWKGGKSGCLHTPEELRESCGADLRTFVAAADPERAESEVRSLELAAAWYARRGLQAAEHPLPRYHLLMRRLRAIALDAPASMPPGLSSPEAKLLASCGEHLAEVLEGRRDPLDLLFPGGDSRTVSAIYRDSRGARLMNRVLARLAAEAAAGGEKTRILEVGAGTGSATHSLLPALKPYAAEYWFTDVSPAFVEQARARFSDDPLLHFAGMDLDDGFDSQPFAAHSFDMIVAANVLHATRRLKPVLERLSQLLVPGGLLLLQEGIRPLGWQDLTFGLTDGWWAFLDEDLRPAHPLLSGKAWIDVLNASGFAQSSVETLAEGGGDVFGQAIVMAKTPATQTRMDKVTVVLEGKRGFAASLASLGKIITATAQAGAALVQNHPDHWSLDATEEGQVKALIDAVERSTGVVDTVVHLLGADTGASSSPQEVCASALHLLRALSGRKCRMVIATAGAVHALEGDACPGYGAATLWGLGKAAALEHTDLSVRLVDLDPYDDTVPARALRSELTGDDGEELVAWRAGRRYTARLQPVKPPRLRKAGIHSGGSYLVTGAFGGLGLLTAEWLANQGAGELVLLGRRDPDPSAADRLDRLRSAGTRVVAVRADVTRADEVAKAVEQCSLPLKGVLHLAGELADGLIAHLEWDKFERVLKPKVAGLLNLHAATSHHPVDFFVVFSSAVGQLGNVGQASHAAACAMAEAFAWNRRAQGLPALAIDWGAWLGAGAAVDRGSETARGLAGVRGIHPSRAFELLSAYIAADETHAVVLDVDWNAFRERLAGYPPHLKNVLGARPRWAEPAHVPSTSDDLPTYLKNEVARLIGYSPEDIHLDTGLNELGIDSLMAVRLRNRLKADWNLEAPIVKFMENPSIRTLAESLQSSSTNAVIEGVL